MRPNVTSTVQIFEGICLHLGERFYLISGNKKFLRKVTWVSDYNFEWRDGWANIDQLKLNPNKKSNVRFILEYENN
jgi:hypothetical protein